MVKSVVHLQILIAMQEDYVTDVSISMPSFGHVGLLPNGQPRTNHH
jgi:hypothetical protein